VTPPPPLARWLLGRLVAAPDRELFLGDLDEEHALLVREQGAHAAARWYRRQLLRSVLPLARHRLAPPPLQHTTPGDPMWRDLLADLRHAARVSARNRLATGAVIATMVLGIGVTTAVFSVVNGVLLRPLPFEGSERVVSLGATAAPSRSSRTPTSRTTPATCAPSRASPPPRSMA
jgi:hypothetical protein